MYNVFCLAIAVQILCAKNLGRVDAAPIALLNQMYGWGIQVHLKTDAFADFGNVASPSPL
jgi:hypothetical protein